MGQVNCCKVSDKTAHPPTQEIGTPVTSDNVKQSAKTADDDEEEEDDDDYVDEIQEEPQMVSRGPRSSVSAEAYGAWNKKQAFQAPVYPKNEDVKARIRQALSQAFMFQALDDENMQAVILAFQEHTVDPGQEVITQFHEDADRLYLIEAGNLKVFKKANPKAPHPGNHVFTYRDAGVFGELAMLYNCPRAATVIAESRSTLWYINRETFNALVKDAAAKKRELYETFLSSVDLLKSLDNYERSKVADALKPKEYKSGEYVIRRGDQGKEFYLLEAGTAKAEINGKEVMSYKPGMYFGELSLLRDEPRAADVIATSSKLKVLSMERAAFRRLLGPLDSILKERAAELYRKHA